MRASTLQQFWQPNTVDPAVFAPANAYSQLRSQELSGPPDPHFAMQRGKSVALQRTTGIEYQQDVSQNVVRRSHKAKFGVSLAPTKPIESSSYGSRTSRHFFQAAPSRRYDNEDPREQDRSLSEMYVCICCML